MKIVLDSPPPAPEWPKTIELRPFDRRRHKRALWAADEGAFQDHYGYIPTSFDSWWDEIDDLGQYQPEHWYIAWDGDEIAGLCLCDLGREDDPDLGWVNELSVRRPLAQAGPRAGALLHALGELYGKGIKKVGLNADSQNLTGAIRLYERAGMSPVRQFDLYVRELRPARDLRITELSV
ncbi:MAG: GNAT family N-acetyltransferase [Dehalococcoidia bacterium]